MQELAEFCENYRRIYCYGAGRYGREICIYLAEHGIQLNGFIVTSREPDITSVLGVKIYAFNDIKIEEDDGIVVAVGSKFADEIVGILRKSGINSFFLVSNGLLEEIEGSTRYSRIYPSNQFVNVLLYHRVASIEDDYWSIAVDPQYFEEQIKWISDNYPICRFGDDFKKIKEPTFVITFDDGYQDNLKVALPILEKYNVPATFFISTGTIGSNFWWDRLYLGMKEDGASEMSEYHSRLRRMNAKDRETFLMEYPTDDENRAMDVEQLQKLAEHPLVDIGAHTVFHSSLSNLPKDEQEWEIKESVYKLKKVTGHKIDLFSYPLGDYNATTIDILKNVGIRKSATVSGGLSGTGDLYRIPRNVVRNQSLDNFKRFVKRCFCVYAEVRE